LNEIGYAQYLGNQEFNGFSSLSSSGDKSATVALILEYGLWDDLEIGCFSEGIPETEEILENETTGRVIEEEGIIQTLIKY